MALKKIALFGAVALMAGIGFGVGADASPATVKALGLSTDMSSQANTTRTPRAQPKKMKSQKAKKAPASTMPRPSNQ